MAWRTFEVGLISTVLMMVECALPLRRRVLLGQAEPECVREIWEVNQSVPIARPIEHGRSVSVDGSSWHPSGKSAVRQWGGPCRVVEALHTRSLVVVTCSPVAALVQVFFLLDRHWLPPAERLSLPAAQMGALNEILFIQQVRALPECRGRGGG